MVSLSPTRRGVLAGGAAALFTPTLPAWPMGKAWRAPRIIVATGVVMAAEATLRFAHPRHDTRFIPLDERGPAFASSPAARLSGAARDRAREGWSLELHHPCAVDELPRPAHLALARLQAALELRGGSLTVVADAVDGLHERSGLCNVIHAQGLRCRDCGRVEDHRADHGLFRGADCPHCGAREALWRHEPFWTGGRLSRGDGVSDVSRLREAVGAADLLLIVGDGEYDQAGRWLTFAASGMGTPILVITPTVDHRTEEIEHGATRLSGAVDAVVPAWVAISVGVPDTA